jgi:hypothetical protein
VLDYMVAYCTRFGITEWCPDLRDTPYSTYNSAMRMIGIDTFRHCLSAKAYECFGADPHHSQDMVTIIKFYDHFVHYVQHSRYLREKKRPGSVRMGEDVKVISNRRRTVSCIRLKSSSSCSHHAPACAQAHVNSEDTGSP